MKKNKNMSPLIIVGIIFVSTALADVSHVLSGHTHPPARPLDVNDLSAPRNAFQSGNPNDFWWMASNSPLKEAYDYYKKCSSKGDCAPPVRVVPGINVAEAHFDPIDVKKNPFLNGEFQAGVVTASSSFSSSSSGCTACGGGAKGGDIAAFHTGTKIDITNNPFFTGKFATAGNGDKIKDENGFIGVQPKQPGFATSHPLSNKKPFATSPPNSPQSFVLGGEARAVQCNGQGYLCVSKDLCVNGVITKPEELIQVRSEVQYCNVNTETCCRLTSAPGNVAQPHVSGKTNLASNINDLVDITAGKSSVTGSSFKFSGGAGSSPGQIQVIIDDASVVKPLVYHNGEIGSQSSASTNKATRDVTPSAGSVFPSTIDYSNVQISNDIRFASTIKGPAYLPPIGGPTPPSTTPEYGVPTQPSIITYQPSVPTVPAPIPTTGPVCPPGTILTPSGICETPIPPCPFGTIRTPSGICEPPAVTPKSCPFGTVLTPDGTCARPTPPPSPQPTPRPCPPGTFLRPFGLCEGTVPGPRCPFGTIQRPDGSCETPTKVCTYGALPDGSCITPTIPPPTPRPCPAGTFLTASGICQPPIPPPTPPPCPPGTILTSSGLCESRVTPTPRPICPPGTVQTPSGICQPPVPITSPTTPGYEYSPSPCPPGTFRTPTGLCETQVTVTTERPQCPPGTYLTPSGRCETVILPTPKPPPRPFQPTASRDYLPPVTPTQPTPPTSGYHYETPTPSFSYPPSTLIPNSNSIDEKYLYPPTTPGYLPPPDTTGSTYKSETLTEKPRRPGRPERPDNTGEPQNTVPVSVYPSRPPPAPRPTPPRPDQNNEPPVGCAAALKCVQEIYCTAEGVVSPVPVVLTKDQELLRVPTTECKEEETGIIGKCCRDPNYKDPWPSANLVNGVDDGQYKEDNLYGQRQAILSTNRLVRSSNVTRNARGSPSRSAEREPSCGERHQNTKPPGPGPIDANFSEYPWQAMILRDSNRSLLCGGAIIRRDAVLTAAHCVEGLDTSDVLIKGGEWKLGIDEEPLPFQIVKVGAILRHPEYVPGSYKNDLAVLVLREKLRPSKNVGTICLPEANQVSTANCVATGWGKRILQLHAKGAIMHHINVDVLDSQKCQQTLQQNFQSSVENYGPNTICGTSDIDHCKVDYGSALACPNSQGHYTLTGIYAWDTGCKEESQIGGYVAPDVEWIESTLAKSIKELKKIEREYLLNSRT